MTAQAVAMSADPRVRAARSRNITDLNYTEEFSAQKARAIRRWYAIRRKVLELLDTQPLPDGWVLPLNKKVGGTVSYWSQLLEILELTCKTG
jgi:hypothetical protein